jgi:hypothetical protein
MTLKSFPPIQNCEHRVAAGMLYIAAKMSKLNSPISTDFSRTIESHIFCLIMPLMSINPDNQSDTLKQVFGVLNTERDGMRNQ